MRPLTSIDPTAVSLHELVPERLGDAADRHAAELGRVAAVLTDDAELAADLLVRAFVACSAGTDDADLRSLSAHVATSWLGGPVTSGTSGRAAGVPSAEPVLRDIRSLPDDQRTLLALCRFGAHTYREAADVLGLAHLDAALLLTTALRSLVAADPTTDDLAVTA